MRDFLKLVRPWVAAMVLFAVAAAAWVASDHPLRWQAVGHVLAGTGLLVAGAVAFNQRLEEHGDAQMDRTADRPLPAGRMTRIQVSWIAVASTVVGLIYLSTFLNLSVAVLGALSWALYVCVYTPLKSITPWQTPVGVLAGAMPILMGAAVAGEPVGPMGLSLFGILFFWQFPHSMAIAWRHRRQFESAGVKLVTVVEPTGRSAGLAAALGALLLLPVSLVPFVLTQADMAYQAAIAVIGVGYFVSAVCFLRHRNQVTSRWLQRISIIYLPTLLVLLLVCKTT